ncbi:uncharacterized protein BROUX77_001693 [Berkeleyomyces rouxiae]|uniref:uncharacterized protein n=1 Tax=Berkeleyomyces rouxiae TaxID=2035830 RepID=UPI003B7D4C04
MPIFLFPTVFAIFAFSKVAQALPPSSPHGFTSSPDLDSSIHVLPSFEESLEDTWSIKQTRIAGNALDGPVAFASIYIKYGVPVPEDTEAAAARHRKRGLLDATFLDTSNRIFLVSVDIGLPKNKFELIFDTASAGVWVFSEKSANPLWQRPYLPETSLSAEKLEGYSWEVENRKGKKASGDVYLDFLSFSTNRRTVICRSQAIQVANSASGFSRMEGVSGVLGLSFTSYSPIKPNPQPSLLANMMEGLNRKLFTLDMRHLSTGSIDFGYINSTLYTGPIGYADVVNEKGYWNFTIEGLISDFSTLTGDSSEFVVADTASSLILLPWRYVFAYYYQVNGAQYSHKNGGFIVPCDSQMPNFTFQVDGVYLAIPGAYLKLPELPDESNICFGGLQSSDGLGINVFGNIAFESSFVVFDPINGQIGWAMKDLSAEGLK